MNIKNRIRKISDAMRLQAEETENAPFLTLEQWKRHADGENIRAEVAPHRLADYDEWERKANERLKQAEEMYYRHNPELLETNYEN